MCTNRTADGCLLGTRERVFERLPRAHAQCAAGAERTESKVTSVLLLRRHLSHIYCCTLSRVEQAELSLQDDGEVSKLEDECNWFRGETNRLMGNRATMAKDIKVIADTVLCII